MLLDLNTWLPPNSGWMLKEARAINDQDQIIGQGEYKGKPAVFLLTLRALAPRSPFSEEPESNASEASPRL